MCVCVLAIFRTISLNCLLLLFMRLGCVFVLSLSPGQSHRVITHSLTPYSPSNVGITIVLCTISLVIFAIMLKHHIVKLLRLHGPQQLIRSEPTPFNALRNQSDFVP